MENKGRRSLSVKSKHAARRLFDALSIVGLICCVAGCISRDTVTVTGVSRSSSGVLEPTFGPLTPSRCFWLGNGASQNVAWDIAVTGTYNGNPAVFRTGQPPSRDSSQLNACYTGPLQINGQNVVTPPWTKLVLASILECQTTPPDNLGTCVTHAADTSCPALANQGCSGGSAPYNFPYCSEGCAFSFGQNDATLEIKSGAADQPVAITPTFYTVTFTRTMIRQMDPCTLSDPQTGTLTCVWREPAGPDGVWHENFKPSLFVARVRAFVAPNGDPSITSQRRYLRLNYVELGAPPINFNCSPSAIEDTRVSVDSCVHFNDATPAYLNSSPTQAVPWVISSLAADHGGDPALTTGARPFIEFLVASPLKTGAGPFLSPDSHFFGVVLTGQSQTAQMAGRLDMGDSPVGWDFQSSTMTGANPADFEVRFRGVPTILPGGVRAIDATFHPTASGYRTATANLVLADTQGHSETLGLDLSGWSGVQPLTLVPDHLMYQDEHDRHPPFGPLPLPWRKQFILENSLQSTIVRTGVTLSGPGAAAFSINEVDNGDVPLPPSRTLPPAISELFAVKFCPRSSGTYSATITVTANEGTSTAPVVAVGAVTLTGVAPSGGAHAGPLCAPPIPVPR